MFIPFICPPGYACNKEGAIFPENLCKVGHVCLKGVMTATEVKSRSCFLTARIGDLN
jgi:hypothetical protein